MNEESCVHIAYLKAVLGNVFGHLSCERAAIDLRASLDMLAAAGALPDEPAPVKTLKSARKRLGIDPDKYIIQHAICPSCWRHHMLEELNALDDPECASPGCKGLIYIMKNSKRIPTLVHPRVSIIQSIRQMFLRPGFAKTVARKESHVPNRNHDPEYTMTDLSDGNMWYQGRTGVRREVGSAGTIQDVPIVNGPTIPLYMHRFGLQLTLNMN
ncbi:hypothetical protein H0H87_012936, partial [Tephrocybe sp. NHM501043]